MRILVKTQAWRASSTAAGPRIDLSASSRRNAPEDAGLDEARLGLVTELDPRAGQLVMLHCFAGLSITARPPKLGISGRIASREWPSPRPGFYCDPRPPAGIGQNASGMANAALNIALDGRRDVAMGSPSLILSSIFGNAPAGRASERPLLDWRARR